MANKFSHAQHFRGISNIELFQIVQRVNESVYLRYFTMHANAITFKPGPPPYQSCTKFYDAVYAHHIL